jgi:hypothetical protein
MATGGGGGEDPFVRLPAASDLPVFEGDFVASEAEAQELLNDVIEYISQDQGSLDLLSGLDDFDGGISFNRRSLRSANPLARTAPALSVQNETFGPIVYTDNTSEIPGAVLNGRIQGSVKSSFAQDGEISKGDYFETSITATLNIDFTNVNRYGTTIKGKCETDEKLYEKVEYTSSWDRENFSYSLSLSGTVNAAAWYGLSISKGGKGMKVRVRQSVRGIEPLTLTIPDDLFSESYREKMTNIYTGFLYEVEIYDNNNQRRYSKSITSFKDYIEYTEGSW